MKLGETIEITPVHIALLTAAAQVTFGHSANLTAVRHQHRPIIIDTVMALRHEVSASLLARTIRPTRNANTRWTIRRADGNWRTAGGGRHRCELGKRLRRIGRCNWTRESRPFVMHVKASCALAVSADVDRCKPAGGDLPAQTKKIGRVRFKRFPRLPAEMPNEAAAIAIPVRSRMDVRLKA